MKIAGTQFPVWLVVIYGLSLLAIAAWPFTAFTSAFAFDAPNSANMPSTYWAVAILVCWPIVPVAAVLISFLAYRRARKVVAYTLAAIAAVPAVILALILVASPIMSMLIMLGMKF